MTHAKPPPRVSLSVVMAGLNEEANLRRSVETLLEALEACTDEFEIILIDDGSRDRTGAIADAMAEEDERIRVHHNPVNVNYGVSLQRGIALARCDWILQSAPRSFRHPAVRSSLSRCRRRSGVPLRSLRELVLAASHFVGQ